MKTNNVCQKQRGMTLLEVLVALAIFATAAISVIRAVSQHIDTIGYLEEKTFASMVADNHMAEVMLSGNIKGRSGKEKLAGREWYWKVSPVDTSNSYLQSFDVSVADTEKGDPLITVRSYIANE